MIVLLCCIFALWTPSYDVSYFSWIHEFLLVSKLGPLNAILFFMWRFHLYKENKDTQEALRLIGKMLGVQVFDTNVSLCTHYKSFN